MRQRLIFTTVVLFAFSVLGFAQSPPPIKQPQSSPRAKVIQTIGIAEVSIDYGRPAVREREILGELVPFDQIWRAGANENTRITFDKPVLIGGKEVSAGTYGLHMIPGMDSWTIILSKDHESWGSYFYVESKDVVRVPAKVTKTEVPKERLTYGFENLSNNGADIFLHWSNFKVIFPLKVNTEQLMVEYIENEYLKNLGGFFWQGFNSAANYTLTNNISLAKGLLWADRSISINKNFTNMSTKSLILRRQAKVKEAEKIIKDALPLANEVSLNAYGYSLLYNINDVDAAIEVFHINAKENPESWNVYDSLAEAYQTKGDKKEAIRYYQQALDMAPDQQQERIKTTIERLNS